MAKKFFYNRVYNTKRTIINITIIVVCIIGIIACFVITSNFQNNNPDGPSGYLSVKTDVTIEVNQKFTNEIFFSKVENFDINDVKVDYPDNFDISKTGTYRINIEINKENYKSNLIIVDTQKPILLAKNISIDEGKTYTAKDFVEKCTDNSNKDCLISFYKDGIDQDGNKVDYSNYTNPGTYAIKIAASDETGNQDVKEIQLVINKKNTVVTPPTIDCKYGNNLYDKSQYLIAIDITTNNCAVSLDLYKDSSMTEKTTKLLDTETTRIKKDVDNLNIAGEKFMVNRKINAIGNITGNGIVGYEIQINVTVLKNGKTDKITEYKLDSNGKRVFISNPYNLPN